MYRAHKTPDVDSFVGTIMFLKSRRAVWTHPKQSMYDNNYSNVHLNVRGDNDFSRGRDDGHRRWRFLRLCAYTVFFTYMRRSSLMGFFGRSFSRARRVLWAERLAEKEPHSVRQQGFSRILTSGIRNELSKRLKLNTCKGESEQPKEETRRTLKKKERRAAPELRGPLGDFCVR